MRSAMTMKWGGALHRFWLWWVEIGLPRWAWRPLCWLRWHTDDSYGECVTCGIRGGSGRGDAEGRGDGE